ncbi:glycosyltransferase [Rhizobium halophytocola]|uniref:2-beta-glucuronyltransferase n=1 Tax=Rhizobium halophytocola TaxID=735519 RepID=A0ABS4DSJ2_9HYPH|nr:glycosyltransferase [Rhizobium halophytocola]MBP1848650.1 2-beta-glucuronyltransferase [Rhizobium halophytocola]
MKFLFLSTHAFLPATRKTSVHFVAEALVARRHKVDTVSVGMSRLTAWKKPQLVEGAIAAGQKNRFADTAPGYRSAAYLPPLHPFSTSHAWVNRLTALTFPLYGNLLPGFLRQAITDADVVVIESGTAIAFFDAVQRLNPKAAVIYFCRDRLDTVGASAWLQATEQRIAPLCDRVIVPSPRMADHLPKTARVRFIPQGIDKQVFDAATVSPYPPGTLNAVSVGNMLFDRAAIEAMAAARPDITYHLFGAGIPDDFAGNVRVYGERPFPDIVPFIRFADFGIAPYRLGERELYLAQSSLKLQQYSYCLLPILVPRLLEGSRGNLVGYDRPETQDWTLLLDRVLASAHPEGWRDGILTWDEVAERIEAEIPASA